MTSREQALVRFAEKLTVTPNAMAEADIRALRDAGLIDREIHDAVQVIGYFAYVNRLTLALGAELESPDRLGQSPAV